MDETRKAPPDHWLAAFERAGLVDGLQTRPDQHQAPVIRPLVRAIAGDPRNFVGVTHWVAYFCQQGIWDVFTDEGNGLKIFLRSEEADEFVRQYGQWWQEQVSQRGMDGKCQD